MPKYRSSNWLWVVPLAFFGLFFYLPIVHAISIGLKRNWLRLLFEHSTLKLMWFTTWQAGLSMVIALITSIPSAYLLYQRRFLLQRVLKSLVAIPFVLPSIVVAIGFFALQKNSYFGFLFKHSPLTTIIMANVFMNFGVAVRIIGSNWSTLDPSLDDAASLDGSGKLRTFWSISFPQLARAFGSAASLCFLYSATNFGIALVIGGGQIKTLETEIYISATQNLDLQRASTLVLAQSLITLLVLAGIYKFSSRNLGLFATGYAESKKDLSGKDFWIQILSYPVIVILMLLPFLGIFFQAFHFEQRWSLQNFINLKGLGERDLLSISLPRAALNTGRNSVMVVIISIVVGLIIAKVVTDNNSFPPLSKFVDFLVQIPIGISTVVLGLGFLITFGTGIFPLRSSWLVTPIAQSIISIPLVVRILVPALFGIPREIIESAELDRASSNLIWFKVQIPMIKRMIYIAAGYAAIISIGDFAAANFLSYGDQATLTTVLFQLISRPGEQNYGMALAASSVLVCITASVIHLSERN